MRIFKKTIALLLAMTMLLSIVGIQAFAADSEDTAANTKSYTVKKISNPDRGEREVDGLIEGGDRENSYTWRLAMRGDEIYIATTRNIASALVNMYGSEFAKAGIDIDTFWAIINVVTNGDIPRNDANEGANIISYNRKTGAFDVIYTADTGDYFRMAVTFGDDVYFGSYSAVPTNPQYILKLDTEGNFTKVFETMGSVSLRANCVYDDHLFFAGADDREVVPEGSPAPVAKMAVLMKSNEDDTVWDRVADYRDFGTTAFDPIHTSWAGAPIWELASHDGYIYATAPTHNGFVIYKGRPAVEGEEANEYGWIWTEVAGLNNGINNPGLSDVEGGEPGTMRSLIGSVYEFNGELYAYNFDHSFGGEASAFAGMMQQLAGKDVKASEYLFYLYDSLHNPQKVWKLNDETGKFEELEEFTKLVEGTTNEYVWRLGEYDGDLYIATMDAGIFYNYLTQLTNGSFFTMSKEERMDKLEYVKELLALIAAAKAPEVMAELKAKLLEIKELLENFDPKAVITEEMSKLLMKYSNLKEELEAITAKIKEALIKQFADEIVDDALVDVTDEGIVTTGADDEEIVIEFSLADIIAYLKDVDYFSVDITIDLDQLRANICEFICAKIAEAKAQIAAAKEAALAKFEETKAIAQAKVEAIKAEAQAMIETAKANAQAMIETAKANAQAMIEAVKDQAKSKIELVKATAQAMIEAVKAEAQAKIDSAIAEAKAMIDSAMAEAKELIEEAKAKTEELVNKVLACKDALLDEIKAKIEENIAKLNEKFEEMKAKLNEMLDKLNELKEKIAEIWNSIDWEGLEMYAYINAAVMIDEWGFDMFRTSDGENFEVITRNGFNDKYNYGCPSFLETEEGLYFGTCNPFYGGQLYLLTNTSDPDPDPETGVTISGSVTTYLDPEEDVTIDLVKSEDVVKSVSFKGSETEYSIENVEAGEYTLVVSKKDHVTREYPVVVEDSDVTVDVKICPLGDVTNDGKTTQFDYSFALAYSRKARELDEYQIKCGDVFGTPDGKLTTSDVSRILQHVRKVKPLYVYE